MVKACVFDMDGTVLDTIGTITHFVNITLEKFGIEKITEDECKYFVGNGAKILIERVLSDKGITDSVLFEKVLESYNSAYNAAPDYMTRPYDEIPELLSELKKRNIAVAIVSNKPDFIARPLSDHFFGSNVDLCFGGREGVRLKPAPDAVFEALEKLGSAPEETVYIGDTGVDMQTGNNAGCKLVIGVLWGFRKEKELLENGADVIVSTPLQILSEVMKLA